MKCHSIYLGSFSLKIVKTGLDKQNVISVISRNVNV